MNSTLNSILTNDHSSDESIDSTERINWTVNHIHILWYCNVPEYIFVCNKCFSLTEGDLESLNSVTIQDCHSRYKITQLCQVLPCWLSSVLTILRSPLLERVWTSCVLKIWKSSFYTGCPKSMVNNFKPASYVPNAKKKYFRIRRRVSWFLQLFYLCCQF